MENLIARANAAANVALETADEHDRSAEACWAMVEHWVARAHDHIVQARHLRAGVRRIADLADGIQ